MGRRTSRWILLVGFGPTAVAESIIDLVTTKKSKDPVAQGGGVYADEGVLLIEDEDGMIPTYGTNP